MVWSKPVQTGENMQKILLTVSVFALCGGTASAADDIMAGYFGNTVVGTSAMGESHTHYKADRTFDVKLSSMMGSFTGKGTWKIDEKGQLCRTYEQPPPGMPNPLCIVAEAHKPGDTWTVTINGQSRTLTLKAGIQ
jgi:hypothetical protein